jgi:hypothetical protein
MAKKLVRADGIRPSPTAMVKPKPRGPSSHPVGAVRESPSLEQILERMGNDRAYTVISHTGNTAHSSECWVVHFEGDAVPKTITADE